MINAFKGFYIDIVRNLELDRLRGFTRTLIVFLILLTFAFVAFFVSVVSTKLDEDTKYYINAISETYKYYPVGASASLVLIQNFRISEGCGDFEGEADPEKLFLRFATGSEVTVSRFSTSSVRLDIMSEELRYRFKNTTQQGSSEKLAADIEGEEFYDCVSIEISLSDNNPVFTMNLLGETAIGQEITDAPDKYSQMLLNANIMIEGKSAISKSRFSYEPIFVPRGAIITSHLPNKDKLQALPATSGVLRASMDSKAIESSIMVYGGELHIQLYREKPRPLKISFINRLSSDNEAVIGFSSLIILIQFLSAIIAFLMRLKFINTTTHQIQSNLAPSKKARRRKIHRENI
ncbi:hypothetical protein [Glaciecola sp. KUL10]|uniref:hypothetical protein n=1 Tax=Glaciecola sp. (strain KUL10) TaxID=2161813 RepID=UPI000D78BBAB|nr:hypothetical protein [Glaciecola sp. KUL10]GBL05514.1 hypothetical protein KUL10_28350 [Glaciecola sp. KUL10]